MKKFLLIAAASLLLGSCANEENAVVNPTEKTKVESLRSVDEAIALVESFNSSREMQENSRAYFTVSKK
ncbi:MAG: hypothetical protein K2M06_00060 [Muribaculaceae bacterium]|nr:hypothetical protein [Muribaculaceae bacterium]